MLQQIFVGREAELAFLEEQYGGEGARLVVIYGRRRVGKTELITRFARGKPHVYLLADERGTWANVRELQARMAAFLGDELFARARLDGWAELFAQFAARASGGRVVVAVDEFPYLVKADPSTPSAFQRAWDEHLSRTNVLLILCGSSIGMMEREALAHSSPLYGRRTGQWMVEPLPFSRIGPLLPGYAPRQLVEAYSVLDGVPLYLQKFEPRLTVEQNLLAHVLRRGAFLYEEAPLLLREEVRSPGGYLSVIGAIAAGNARFGDIASAAGMDKTSLSKYLDTLRRLRLVRRERPVTARREAARDALYRLGDNYLAFWYSFVHPNRALVEGSRQDELLASMREGFQQHVSFVFEDVVRQHLASAPPGALPFAPTRVGRWWHRGEEVDVVALSERERAILLVECKWSDRVDARRVLDGLAAKAEGIDWLKGRRRIFLGVAARSFRERPAPEEGALTLSLDDIASEAARGGGRGRRLTDRRLARGHTPPARP